MKMSNWRVCLLLTLALVLMLGMNYFFNWWLIPDIFLLILLQWFLLAPIPAIWRFALPLSLLMDFAGQIFLGFHGLMYALVALTVMPLSMFWSRASVLEQFIILVLISLGYIVVRALLIFALTDIPASSGWYWPIISQLAIWPFLQTMSESWRYKIPTGRS